MPLSKRFGICLPVTASAFAQAQPLAIDVKPARSVDLESRRVRTLPNGDLIGTSVNAITLISEGYSVPANPSDRLAARSELIQTGVSVWFKLCTHVATGNSFWSDFDGHHILLVQGG